MPVTAELSLIVVLVALGLAVLLVRDSLRADRAMADRAAALSQQAAAFSRLYPFRAGSRKPEARRRG